ncbi:tyrosine-type recombinase/integrase [Streptomyces sp. WG7]|uniref:tyrosine-type recombinase/integrase n=1 Tax=Streptomyces sp. WG7 TaxID=3417650 RepID=UPI003CFAA505
MNVPAWPCFPSRIRNPDGRQPISYGHFNQRLKTWVADLDFGGAYVAHQARHTLATDLLRVGATLTRICRSLGQLSERTAEHYVKITNSGSVLSLGNCSMAVTCPLSGACFR